MESFEKALSYALCLIAYRPRTQAEIRRRLKKKKCSFFLADKVVKYLQDNSYLDDRRFIADYLEYSLARGWGPLRVNFNLKKIGISDSLRKEAVERSGRESRKLIREQLAAKMESLVRQNPGLKQNQIKEKAAKFLANKGFFYKDIRKQLNQDKDEN